MVTGGTLGTSPESESRRNKRTLALPGVLAVVLLLAVTGVGFGVWAIWWHHPVSSKVSQSPSHGQSPGEALPTAGNVDPGSNLDKGQPFHDLGQGGTSTQPAHTSFPSRGRQFRRAIAEFVPGQLLIQFRPSASDEERKRVRGKINAEFTKRVGEVPREGFSPYALTEGGQSGGLELVSFRGSPKYSFMERQTHLKNEDRQQVLSAIESIAHDPAVQFAEPNYVIKAFDNNNLPNSSYYANGKLWGLYGDTAPAQQPYGIHADGPWMAGHVGSQDIFVAVIDTGIDISHRDLLANIWKNTNASADTAYPGDVHGWNVLNENSVVYQKGDPSHGTMVTGIIAAAGATTNGMVGVSWHVTVIPVKCLNAYKQATVEKAVEAITYVRYLKRIHYLNIVAINMSWGVPEARPLTLLTVIKGAAQDGILCIAAAGNDFQHGNPLEYPASFSDTDMSDTSDLFPAAPFNPIISVASIQSDGQLAIDSNRGAINVHLGAPGVGILSTLPANGYGVDSGTSMAAPFVTGAVALYKSIHSSAKAEDIRNAILNSVVPTSTLQNVTASGGRLDVRKF
jgi:subtilisin family serine protease